MAPVISVGDRRFLMFKLRAWQVVRSAIFTLIFTSVINAIQGWPGAAVNASELAVEREVFAEIAAELMAHISSDPTIQAEGGGDGLPKLAIAPFRDNELPLAPAFGREFNDLLTAELLAISMSKRSFRIKSRDSLQSLIEDMFEVEGAGKLDTTIISLLLNSAQVDILIVGRIERIGTESLTISYEALDGNGSTLAQAQPRRLPWRSEFGQDLTAHTLEVAVKDAVSTLSSAAHDLTLLRLGGIHYKASGQLTNFSHYLEESISIAFGDAYGNELSGRGLRIQNVELTNEDLNNMRGIEASQNNLKTANLGAYVGTYTLTGSYWPQGETIEIRLSLTASNGLSTGWKGAVLESDIDNVDLHPSSDFGSWRLRDGIGPIVFTLTTDHGKDPVYRVGEKMNLIVQSDQDIWLRCYYLQQDGKVFQIFPNPLQRTSAITGGRPHTIPGKELSFNFEIMPPVGKELVKCFALGKDVTALLPHEFEQSELAPLHRDMKHNLPNLFRNLKGIAITEQSTVINVVE